MNHVTQSFLSSAVVSAVLWLACVANTAHAVAPPGNIPPNYDKTKEVGSLLQKGEKNMVDWRTKLTGELANYDAYTQQQNDSEVVLAIMKTCKDANNKKSFGCDFTQVGSGADVMASALLGAQGYADDAARTAAFNFVIKMTNFMPLPYPGDKAVFKDPKNKDKGLTDDGVSYFANLFKQLPALTTAQNALLAIFADRERQPGLAGNMPVGDTTNKTASILEVLDYEAGRRYMNPDWFEAMNSATDQAVLREIAYMLAFQNYMMVKDYEQNQRIEALLVAQISSMNALSNISATQNMPSQQKQQQKKIDQQSN